MPWDLNGNTNTNPPNDFLGTTDNHPLVIKTNGGEVMRLDTSGQVLIGTTGVPFTVGKLLVQGHGPNGGAVLGLSDERFGAAGSSDTGDGVIGSTGTLTQGSVRGTAGVRGVTSGLGVGVVGINFFFPDGVAGQFLGNVDVRGTVSKFGGGFLIDHPLDPANKQLRHSFVESPDMKNLYDGIAICDQRGEAVVDLPAWFDALNADFRYQLTAIGASAPGLFIAEEIAHHRFKIAGGSDGLKVSWHVTATRQDVWAKAHRLVVEEDKPIHHRGLYLHPMEHGLGYDQSVDSTHYADAQKHMSRIKP
jgi:hypothetical protein